MIAHAPENVLYGGRDNLHLGGAVPPGAHLYGMASHDRGRYSAPPLSWFSLCSGNICERNQRVAEYPTGAEPCMALLWHLMFRPIW
jgi:hypothetical protein